MMHVNLTDLCAPGTRISDEFVATNDRVELRVISLTPANDAGHPAIVFVPGWITLIPFWKNVLVEMTRDFRVIYIETREKISSKIIGKVRYDVESIGSDVVAIISKFGLKPYEYILFGSSLGATVILDRSRFLEQEPLCLVLIGPNAEFRVPRFGMMIIRPFYPPLYFILKPVVKWYLKNFRLDYKSDQAQYQKYCANLNAADPRKLKRAIIPFSKYSVWHFLTDIDLPVLIIGASKDKLHEPENLAKMTKLLKFSTFVDMETNKNTHSKDVMFELYKYINQLPTFHCDCERCKAFKSGAEQTGQTG